MRPYDMSLDNINLMFLDMNFVLIYSKSLINTAKFLVIASLTIYTQREAMYPSILRINNKGLITLTIFFIYFHKQVFEILV